MTVCPHKLARDLEEWGSFCFANGVCRCCGEVMDVEMNLRAQIARLGTALEATGAPWTTKNAEMHYQRRGSFNDCSFEVCTPFCVSTNALLSEAGKGG